MLRFLYSLQAVMSTTITGMLVLSRQDIHPSLVYLNEAYFCLLIYFVQNAYNN